MNVSVSNVHGVIVSDVLHKTITVRGTGPGAGAEEGLRKTKIRVQNKNSIRTRENAVSNRFQSGHRTRISRKRFDRFSKPEIYAARLFLSNAVLLKAAGVVDLL